MFRGKDSFEAREDHSGMPPTAYCLLFLMKPNMHSCLINLMGKMDYRPSIPICLTELLQFKRIHLRIKVFASTRSISLKLSETSSHVIYTICTTHLFMFRASGVHAKDLDVWRKLTSFPSLWAYWLFPASRPHAVPRCTGAAVSLPDTPTAHETRSGGLSWACARSGPPETRGPPLLSAIPGLGTRTYGTDSGEAGRVEGDDAVDGRGVSQQSSAAPARELPRDQATVALPGQRGRAGCAVSGQGFPPTTRWVRSLPGQP